MTPSDSLSDFLKPASVVALLSLLVLAPSIQDRLSEEASKYVDDSDSARHGLPTQWENTQVICVFFPEDSPHSEFSDGVTMIGSDGEEVGNNQNLNTTGACIGGLGGYSNGVDFMMDSTRLARGHLSVGYDVGQWGHFVHTIGGLNAETLTGDFKGAYWNLNHNGAPSTVGIGNLVMSEGDIIEWSIGTW